MRMPKRGEKGFTLIELLIVLAIMGVLAAVIVRSVRGVFGRGAEQAYDTDKKTLQTVVQTFFQDTYTVVGRDETSKSDHFYPTYGMDVEASAATRGDGGSPVAMPTTWANIKAGCFVNMPLLLAVGLLSEIPESAAVCNRVEDKEADDDNYAGYDATANTITLSTDDPADPEIPSSGGGTYGWYVDTDANVASWPTFDDTANGGGVYP